MPRYRKKKPYSKRQKLVYEAVVQTEYNGLSSTVTFHNLQDGYISKITIYSQVETLWSHEHALAYYISKKDDRLPMFNDTEVLPNIFPSGADQIRTAYTASNIDIVPQQKDDNMKLVYDRNVEIPIKAGESIYYYQLIGNFDGSSFTAGETQHTLEIEVTNY